MIACGEDELICDLAETYHIYDYKSLPVDKVAIFSVGLREESRIYRKMLGYPSNRWDERLLALILDKLNHMFASEKADIKSVYSLLFGEEEKEGNVMSFTSPEEFEEARRRIINGETS